MKKHLVIKNFYKEDITPTPIQLGKFFKKGIVIPASP